MESGLFFRKAAAARQTNANELMALQRPQARRIVFLAAHLSSSVIASGGDVLFCEIAARIARSRPNWDIRVIAPDFAERALSRFFETVIPIETGIDEASQGTPARVAFEWMRRNGTAARKIVQAGPAVLHSTGDFFVDTAPSRRALTKARFIWSGVVHHINAPPLQRHNPLLISTASYLLQRMSFQRLKRADAISVLNQGVRRDLVARGFDAARVHVVGAGIDVNRFELNGAPISPPHLIWLNRLEPTKGIFDLPGIAKRLPREVVIDVIGTGPEVHARRLKQQLVASGVAQRCILHGYVSDESLQEFLRKASAFISCSYEEGWGISIAEALAAGLPCVVYDLPSHRELFGNDVVLTPLGNIPAFARAVQNVLQRQENDDLRAFRRERAKRYSLDECARRQENIFASLLDEPQNGVPGSS